MRDAGLPEDIEGVEDVPAAATYSILTKIDISISMCTVKVTYAITGEAYCPYLIEKYLSRKL